MTTLVERTVLAEFADVLEEYTRRQQELLGLLRRFHAMYLEVVPSSSVSVEARHRASGPIGVRLAPHRALPRWQGPRATTIPPSGVEVAHRLSVHPTSPAAPSEGAFAGWPDDVIDCTVQATKRDYDYFNELDSRLRRLGSGGEAP